MLKACLLSGLQRCWRSYFFGSRSFCQKWIYNPIRSFHPPEKRIYDPILSDPFRSDPYCVIVYLRIQFQKSCILWISRHARLRDSLLMRLQVKNYWMRNFFSSFKEKLAIFCPFPCDPWCFGSTIQSRSIRRKWIYNPITILKKEDLDPKGSRSDHGCQIH